MDKVSRFSNKDGYIYADDIAKASAGAERRDTCETCKFYHLSMRDEPCDSCEYILPKNILLLSHWEAKEG